MKSASAEPPLRVVVGLDVFASVESAIEVATRLARASRAELAGLFVEDEALFSAARLPFAAIVGHTGTLRSFDRAGLERQLRAAQARARRALTGAAEGARLTWSFQVTRGGVLVQLMSSARRHELIVLGGSGAPQGAPHSTLAVLGDRFALDNGLLEVATRVAREQAAELVVLLQAGADAPSRALSEKVEARQLGRVSRLPSASARGIADSVRRERAALLLVSANSTCLNEPGFSELRARLACPVVIVR